MMEFAPPDPLQTAVLLVVFNRPDSTRRVFQTIRSVQPPRLYIAADGPRPTHPEDDAKCQQAREIVSQIDWLCTVQTLFREENTGCGRGPAEACDWFFSQEEEGIILEDDCVPDKSFFWFCQELLEKYRHDKRVMHITGTNLLSNQQSDGPYSYFFSIHPHEWGWASWRRAWMLYDYQITQYPETVRTGKLRHLYSGWLEYQYRMSKFRNTYGNSNVNWWDYQWSFTLHTHRGLAIVPAVNLVQNIGFGADATHTLSANDIRGKYKATSMPFPLKHPPQVVPNQEADRQSFRLLWRRLLMRKVYSLFRLKGYDSRG